MAFASLKQLLRLTLRAASTGRTASHSARPAPRSGSHSAQWCRRGLGAGAGKVDMCWRAEPPCMHAEVRQQQLGALQLQFQHAVSRHHMWMHACRGAAAAAAGAAGVVSFSTQPLPLRPGALTVLCGDRLWWAGVERACTALAAFDCYRPPPGAARAGPTGGKNGCSSSLLLHRPFVGCARRPRSPAPSGG